MESPSYIDKKQRRKAAGLVNASLSLKQSKTMSKASKSKRSSSKLVVFKKVSTQRSKAQEEFFREESKLSRKEEQIDVDSIDPNDLETIDIHLRDSLIKSFMVIFTNAESQHLLLNKDLIDIAFNCLEFCNDCSL